MRFIMAALIAAISLSCCVPALSATTGVVRGNVRTDTSAAGGALITLSGENTTVSTHTDAAGDFSFPQISFGHYTITAHLRGLPDSSQEIDVSSDTVTTVALRLTSVKEIGRVTASSRAGASGAPVSQNALGRSAIAALPINNSLNSIVQTVPGIVKFSYDEPVAHGFHGVTYEVDGAPLPQSTSSNFAELIDPKNVDSVEVFTGAFPAEYGGSRQGAVVNIISNRNSDFGDGKSQGSFSLGGGNYATGLASLDESFKVGATRLFLNGNFQENARGLDAPTYVPIHDIASKSDQFLRFITPAGQRGTLSMDFSNQLAQFQIPINTDVKNPLDPTVSVPGTDDVQREYDRFVNANYTLNSKGGNGYLQIIPWARYTRIAYDGDVANDILATQPDPSTGLPVNLIGLRQDRSASYTGLRVASLHVSAHHAIKFGLEGSVENFQSKARFVQLGKPDALDDVAQRGSLVGAYVQDKWSPSRTVTVSAGLRYDHSTGFVSGNQLSPRIGINLAPDSKNVVHFYYGRLYAAPALEDVRRSFTILSAAGGLPVYDLRPERDSYTEMGVAHTFSSGFTGYVNYFRRNAVNVLDTTQLLNTPLFAVFNNAVGRVEGMELRLQRSLSSGDSWFVSATASRAEAGGISGSTFLFPPTNDSLQPEDHDQTYEGEAAYTHRFGKSRKMFATLQSDYGTGYPVQFQSGPDRLPAHLGFDFSLGREAGRGADRSLGFNLSVQNLLNHQYPIKVANGFNTTQISTGRKILFRLTAPI